jgi:predicted RNA-binding Zn-ribbon protein involved in translation (DUF1610 family)
MLKRALVGIILVLLALILIGASLVMPWYKNESKMSGNGMSASISLDYYFDHAKFSSDFPDAGGIYINASSEELSYDDEPVRNFNFPKTFGMTRVIVILGLLGCIFGLFGAALVALGKLKPSIGALIVFIALILCIIAPIYLMAALPSAFEADGMTMPGGDDLTFFGSEKESLSGGTQEFIWGPTIGWFLAIFAVIFNIFALILVATSKPEPKPFSMEGPIPLVMSVPPDDTPSFTIESDTPQQVPMAQPVISQKKGDEFQCPECGKIFIVALKKRPLHIRCPYCGLEGMVD